MPEHNFFQNFSDQFFHPLKKIISKKIVLIFFCFILCFCFIKYPAKAETVFYSEPNGNILNGVGQYGGDDLDHITQKFILSDEITFDHLKIKLNTINTNTNNFFIDICPDINCNTSLFDVRNTEDFEISTSTDPTNCSELPIIDISFSEVNLSAGTYYLMIGYVYNSTGITKFCDNENKITGCWQSGHNHNDCTTTNDLWFKLYHQYDTTSSQFTLQLLTPSPGSPFTTYYNQPDSYIFNYINPLNWYPQIRFMVKRMADPLSNAWPDYVNSSTFWTSTTASSTLTMATSTFQLPDGVYELDAYFWANIPASPVHATTTFTIHTGGSYGGYTFATSSPGSCFNNTPLWSVEDLCGTATTTLGCSIKESLASLVQTLFSPSCDAISNFKTSYSMLKKSFPFNTFFELTDTISSVASSTIVTSSGTIKIPFINSSGQYFMMSVISSSTLSNWIGQNNYNLFRTTIGYFLWLIAVAVVYFTIKFI